MTTSDLPQRPATRLAPAPSPPRLPARLLMRLATLVIGMTGRLDVSGELPAELRGRPYLLVANHIGVFDSAVLLATCRQLGIAPRFLTKVGLLDTPVLGPLLRKCGHHAVDQQAIGTVELAVQNPSPGPLLIYPEGRISLDPGLWPERGKTGAARLALAAQVPVLTMSQWGAHEVIPWATPPVRTLPDLVRIIRIWLRALDRRVVFRVKIGGPIDLTDLRSGRPGDARRAHARIMQELTDGLATLRPDEPDLPRFCDPTRPHGRPSPWRPQR